MPAPLAGSIERYLHTVWASDRIGETEWFRQSQSLAVFAASEPARVETETWASICGLINDWERRGNGKITYGDPADEETKLVDWVELRGLVDVTTKNVSYSTIILAHGGKEDVWNLSLFPVSHKKKMIQEWEKCGKDKHNTIWISGACKIVSLSGIGHYFCAEEVMAK